MNTHIHRTISNHARGCLMAVAETAKSSGKTGGEVRPTRRSKTQLETCRKTRFSLCAWSSINSALSRKSSERYAPSQLGTDPVAPWLVFRGMPLAANAIAKRTIERIDKPKARRSRMLFLHGRTSLRVSLSRLGNPIGFN